MKTLLKLLVTAAIANAGWHVADVWLSYFKFKDAVSQTSQFSPTMSTTQLRSRILELAAQYSVPITEDSISIRRDERQQQHTFIDGSYQQQIELFPRFKYPWTFEIHTDTFTDGPGSGR
jgi:hypothetical protein